MVRKEYRSHVGVILTILEFIHAQNTVGITKIVRDANLAYDRAKTYLDRLEKKGFLKREEQGRRKFYTLTTQGCKFLKRLKDTKVFFETLGFPL